MVTKVEIGNGGTILTTLWFTHSVDTIGMVLVEFDKYHVAYIGVGVGDDEELDAMDIATAGDKLPKAIAQAAFSDYNLDNYKPN